jgi:folate-binding Fe-S cluster repair protein YgfZ
MDTAKLFPQHNTMLDPSKRRVLSFGEGPGAFGELQITDTLCPISRGYIQLNGPDSRKFLQGQVTCDMQTVTDQQVIRGAHCTPKGRIIFLFSALCDSNDNILLETHSSVIPQAIANLKKYAVFFKTEISDLSASLTTFLISGPSSAKSIATLCHQPLPQPGMHVEEADIRLRCIAENHYSVTCTSEDSARVIAEHQGLTLCGEAYADLITLRSGFADVTEDTLDKFIPQMLNLDRQAFISFQKGC